MGSRSILSSMMIPLSHLFLIIRLKGSYQEMHLVAVSGAQEEASASTFHQQWQWVCSCLQCRAECHQTYVGFPSSADSPNATFFWNCVT